MSKRMEAVVADGEQARPQTFAEFTSQMAMMIRLLVSQESARQYANGEEGVIRIGLSEKDSATGAVAFHIEQGDENQLCVTVTIEPGFK
jgi:hypothetical protein